MNLAETEKQKYDEVWSDIPEYRVICPGLENVSRFMKVMQPQAGSTVLDIGCGTGNAGLELQKLGMQVWWLDLTDAGLDSAVPRNRFIQAPLWTSWRGPTAIGWTYGFCCDVMEHIPPEFVMLCLQRILLACHTTWFEISLVADNCGAYIGQHLHLTVRPFRWWIERFGDLGAQVIDARHLEQTGLYVVSRK